MKLKLTHLGSKIFWFDVFMTVLCKWCRESFEQQTMTGAVRGQHAAPWDRVKSLFLGNDWKA